jgi:hypothetical protein
MAVDLIVAESFIVITAGIAIFFGIFNAAAVYAVDMEEVVGQEKDDISENDDMDDADNKGQDRLDTKKIEHINPAKMAHMLDLA